MIGRLTSFPFIGTVLLYGVVPLLLTTAADAQDGFGTAPVEQEVFRLKDDSILTIIARSWLTDTGSVHVPEVRSRAGSRSIRLPVYRIRAQNAMNASAPIFWLSGGPGQSNLSSFQYNFFIGEHDHVMVGYRGVDGDVSLDCPEVVQALEEGSDLLSEEMLSDAAKGYGSCSERLIRSGVDLDGYTPLEVADDIEAVRLLLGYDRIIIVAESYGTRIAYLYARTYASHIERMVMVGSNPPGHMVWDPYANDRIIERYARLWSKDAGAVRRYPDLVRAMRVVRDDFPTSWLFLPIHEGTVRAAMNAFLFHTETAAQGFDAYVAAANGDPSGLWLMSVVASYIFPTSVNWGDNASKAMSSDGDTSRNYREELDPEDALFGAPLGAFLWSAAESSSWPIRTIPEEYRTMAGCSVQTLFLSGSLDASTPAENVTNDMLPHFPNGTHVILSEAGHVMDLWRSQPAAVHTLVKTFIDEGKIDTSRIRYVPVSFDVAWGFPLLAKLTIGILLLLSVVLIGGIVLGIRRVRRLCSAGS